MSYNIDLYDRDFLRGSIAEKSGDLTNADPIPMPIVEAIADACIAAGFRAELHPPEFIKFLRHQGVLPSRDFALLTSTFSGPVPQLLRLWEAGPVSSRNRFQGLVSVEAYVLGPIGTSAKGRERPVVTVCDFSASATCYAGSTGRDRPEADVKIH
ncbi:hypothetical protein [Massilia sp. METH4]|uniref:hypothetical protein n=1 Tax=Massilia sp. METH4 TaxID=3123041 RepID=UPI0030D16CC1